MAGAPAVWWGALVVWRGVPVVRWERLPVAASAACGEGRSWRGAECPWWGEAHPLRRGDRGAASRPRSRGTEAPRRPLGGAGEARADDLYAL